MRAYSEIIASFRRGGPFPIEADYIFETEAKLKEFYSSPEENAILHKGLLKVVENDGDGNQALYWVTRKETNDELEFTKLITSKSDETIADLITRLEQEIKDRKTADDAIWGSIDHTSVPEDLNSLKDIAEEITKIREHLGNLDSTDEELQSNIDKVQAELDKTQEGVGLGEDGAYVPDTETTYLKDSTSVMDSLRKLDELVNHAIHFNWVTLEDTPSIELDIDRQITGTTISGNVKVSTDSGNGITIKNDGLFYKLTTEYLDGLLTIKVNDNVIGQHQIGLSAIVEDAKYDPDTEELVIVFKLLTGDKQVVRIPVGTLIREWEVDNSHPAKVVVLEKEDVLGGGTDKLSADVRLYVDKYQILEKRDNTLYVKGTTDNLTHNDEALDVVIDRIISSGSDTNDALQAEIDRAKAAEQALDNKITAETTRADKVETQLRNDLDAEIKRATGVETDLQKQIDNLQDSTSTDISELEAALKAEVERSTEKDAAHDTAISEEVARATEAENQLRRDLTTTNEKVTANTANIEKNADAIAKETERATAAESSLSDGLRAEIERATTKETELEGVITTHINDTNNPHNVTKEQVGLGKVDNTTDLEKPVSVATQAALDTKADLRAILK